MRYLHSSTAFCVHKGSNGESGVQSVRAFGSAHVEAEPLLLRDRCEGENRGAGEQRACARQGGATNWKSRRDSPYIMISATPHNMGVREECARSPTGLVGRARTVVHGVANVPARPKILALVVRDWKGKAQRKT